MRRAMRHNRCWTPSAGQWIYPNRHAIAPPPSSQALVLRLWQPMIADAVREGPGGFDHKTRLQEMAVAAFERAPDYRVDTSGPDHARVFTARVAVGTEVLGAGTGSSKKEAEQAAARQAVQALNRTQAAPDVGVADADADSERRAS